MFSFTDTFVQIKRRMSWKFALFLISVSSLYFFTRLLNILALPIFVDEGIYVNWARIAANDPNWRFISLLDGKQVLQTWGTIPFVKLFPDNLLFAGRLFSVSSGFIGMIGMMSLSGYLWGKRAVAIAAIIYLFSPFFLFYDRLALVDSAVNASVIWLMFVSILLVRMKRLDVAVLFGAIAGIGMLAKSSLFMFIGLSCTAIVVFQHGQTILNKVAHVWRNKKVLFDYIFLYLAGLFLALSIYLSQRFFSPFFHNIAQKNLMFILTFREWLANPFQLVMNNIQIVPQYIFWESGWIIPVLGLVGIYMLWRNHEPLGHYLVLWIISPFIIIVMFNKVVYPRYLIFFAGLLSIAAIYALNSFSTNTRRILLLITSVVLLFICFPQWFSVTSISLPPIDRGQYIEGASAVWGTPELMQIIRSSTTDGKSALVLAEGDFGLIADVLRAYVKREDRIDVRGLWPLNESDILTAQQETVDKHVFVVFPHRNDFPIHWQQDLIEEVKVFGKPNGSPDKVYLFRLRPPVSPR